MNFHQYIPIPYVFQVEEGLINMIPKILKKKNLSFKRPIVVSGKTYSKKISKKIISSFKSNVDYYSVEEISRAIVTKVSSLLNSQSNDLIISVGGGKVGDLCKKLALDNNIPVVIVPTLISNDGLISPISVINNTKGGTDSIPGAIPFGVIIDLEIIEKSPEKYIFSAAGDILSNLSATQDWIYASKTKKVQINDIAFHLSKTSALALIDRNFSRVNDKNTIRHIVSGQINSGIAMTLAGNSRPCSGSEHLISHSIDKHKLSEDLHGEQVGKLSLFSLFLQGKLDDRILNYAKKINLLNPPKALENLKDFNKIIYDARLMRPNRATILDKYSNKEIRTFYENWIEKLNDFNK